MGDYDKETQAQIMSNHVVCGDSVKLYNQYFNGAGIIVYCCNIRHSEIMTDHYKDGGWKAAVIHSKLKRNKRNDAMDGFRAGYYNQLINADLLGEGIDVPDCSGVQLLRRTASLVLYLQMVARGMTPVYSNIKCKKNPNGYDLEIFEERKK